HPLRVFGLLGLGLLGLLGFRWSGFLLFPRFRFRFLFLPRFWNFLSRVARSLFNVAMGTLTSSSLSSRLAGFFPWRLSSRISLTRSTFNAYQLFSSLKANHIILRKISVFWSFASPFSVRRGASISGINFKASI